MIQVTYTAGTGLATVSGPGGFTQLRMSLVDARAFASVIGAGFRVR